MKKLLLRYRNKKCLFITSPLQADLRLLRPPSGQSAGSGARTRDRSVSADPRADSLTTLPPTPPCRKKLSRVRDAYIHIDNLEDNPSSSGNRGFHPRGKGNHLPTSLL
ncbi:hypothetical protein PoB_007237800 [Plakobranchus ocellatus]|uniref:Uncharacterized protein n=1 Tax=Plakobranchus ocellatus TaxID=259542 RepID=A0AAV4DNF9_9GAST|nr:hypothetical protein PoB_007237800 [Plakobranchus ocellatus]